MSKRLLVITDDPDSVEVIRPRQRTRGLRPDAVVIDDRAVRGDMTTSTWPPSRGVRGWWTCAALGDVSRALGVSVSEVSRHEARGDDSRESAEEWLRTVARVCVDG